jgi:gliding motility-associated-like protein
MKLLVNIFLGQLQLLLCVVTLFFNVVHAQGDNPCSAQALTVNTSCTYSSYNYPSSSTGSTGIPAPGCANYPTGGDDVWFSAVVPASGILIVDLNTATGGPSDMGMAFYSANSCAGPFALIECDDDDSNNGTMPYINRPGLTPGSTVYIRVWEYGADAYGAFRICASTSTTTACVGGQNNNCATADPFCTGTAYNYCNSTGVASGGSYNCLLSTPNPMWMYLNVQTSGSIDIQIQQFTNGGTGIDVDFALYGPYTGISAACSAITGSTATVDCSYSTAFTEYANITSAVAGQWYMLLITNYNGAAGYIQFNQTGGTGTTNCNIVNPSCLITGVTATPSNCNASNQYSVSGAISVSNPPTSGTLTVSSSCGGSQTFNAPFTSPINYNLTGLTPTGGSCTVTAAFSALSCSLTQTYTSPLIPIINGGVDQTVCANTAVTLTASGGSTYSWTGGVSNGVSFTPSTTTTYTVTGTNAQGCTSTDPVLVTVNTLPTTNAGGDAAVCAGASTSLTASGATTYSWSPATGLSATSGATVTATPSATTTYTVTGTTGLCTSTDQVVVTVNPLPTTNARTDQTICIGSSASLTASGATTYSWSPSTSLSATSGATVTSSSASTITYTVTGSTGAGCTSTDQVIVNVNPIATVNANADQSVCAGGLITLSGSVGGAATSGTWSASSGSFSNANSLSSTYTPSATSGTITLTLTSDDPSGPCPAVTDQMVVTINTSPIVNAGSDASFCVGGSTLLTASGADNYSWSPSTGLSATAGATVTANPGSTTSYTVTGTSASGCTSTDLVVVTVNPIPTVNAGADQTICQGPTVTLTASGASTYSWTGGITNGTSFSPVIGSTTYTVTGTSTAGCTNTDDVVVTVNAVPVIVANDVSVCATNTVSVTASGGATYSWSPATNLSVASGSSVTFTPGSTTTYTVTGTSAAGCTSTDQATVSVLANAPINAGQDVSICIGAATTLTATGGVTYSWNSGLGAGNGFSVSPTSTTTYTVVGTDAANCQGTDLITITVNPLPIVNGGVDQTVCAGTSITLSGSGASTYSWNNGAINGTSFVPSATTTYTVTGTSASGCTATDQVLVTVNPLPTVNAGSDQTVCTGTSVTLTASGASTYSWSGGISNGVVFTPSATTTYTVTGTSANGCTSTDQVTVTVLGNAIINAGSDVSICAGTSSTLTASGGVSYTWNNGVGIGNGLSVTPAVTTTYTVTGTDASGCTGTDAVLVTVNPLPVVNGGADQTVCAGIDITLSGSGASTYSWNNGVTNGSSFVPAATATYTVTGTSLAGCTGTDQVLVTVNPLPTVNAGGDQTVCAGTLVTLTGSGASTYSWSGGISNGVAFTPSATATYTLTGTSAAGCTSTDQVIVNVNPLPVVNAGADQNVCDGASVTLTATGAATYSWTGGVANGVSFVPSLGTTNYTVTGTSAASCTATDQIAVTVNPNPDPVIQGPTAYCVGNFAVLSTSQTFSSYSWSTGATTSTINATIANNPISVTVTNSFGCSALSSNFIVSENSVITANFTETICQGGSVVIHGITETVAGVYSQTFTSATGCDSVSNVTLVVNPLPAVSAGSDIAVCTGTQTTLTGSGAVNYSWNNSIINNTPFTQAIGSVTYTLTGTDANGCVNTDQVVVLVNPLPSISAGTDQVICIGQSVTLAGSGGSTYLWNNSVSDGVSFNPTLTNTYTVIGTDVNGCVSSDQVLVTVNTLPTVNAGVDQAICLGETITLSGIGASTYTWDNAVVNNVSFSPASTTTYTVTGTDVNGCINTDQVQLTVNTLPVVSAGPDQAVCINSPVTVTGSGASIYTWNNNALDGVSFIISTTTDYTVTGTDVNGCTSTDVMTIIVNGLPLINAGPDQTICIGAGVILSGSGAVNYVWNNSVSDGVSFNPTLTNTYTVTGTDVNGCVSSDQVLVTVNTLPTVNAGVDQVICAGESVTLSGSGANTYTWDNAVSNNVPFSPNSSTTYTVTGTDANGCVNTDQVQVTVNLLPTVNAGNDQAVCLGASVTLTGAGAVTYSWDNGVQNDISFSPLVGTVNYTVTGTSNFGCTNTDQVSVTVNPLPAVVAGLDDAICIGESSTLSGSGASTYTWNNGVVDGVVFSPSSTLTYTVTGTSSAGCTNSDQVIVTVNPLPTVFAGNDISVCDGVVVTLTGSGAATYAWDNGVTNGLAFNSPVGTLTYTVTGTSVAGCVNTDQVNVTVNTAPLVVFEADTTIGCLPLLVNFTNTTSGSSNCIWTLSDGTVLLGCGSVSNVFDQVGCYDVTLTVTDDNGCSNSSSSVDYICVEAPPIASFTPSATELSSFATEVSFLNSSYGASSYNWTFGESSYSIEENPVYVFPEDEGEYVVTLVASSPLGCSDVATATITVKEELVFFVPNTFTPDNDDYNEVFKPVFYSGFDPYDFSLLIFNRWGEIVFESRNAEVGWDGSYGSNNEIEIVQDGTYTWVIRYRISENKGYRKATGHVNLIR